MSWNDSQRTRLAAERSLLARYFPSFRWIDPMGSTKLEGALKTNAGYFYQIRVVIPPDYPASLPSVYILSPCPLQGNGHSLREPSREMHTLSPDSEGHVKVCHHSSEVWTESMTLYKVVLKIRLWLEAYEGHIATGQAIDFYLKHMRG